MEGDVLQERKPYYVVRGIGPPIDDNAKAALVWAISPERAVKETLRGEEWRSAHLLFFVFAASAVPGRFRACLTYAGRFIVGKVGDDQRVIPVKETDAELSNTPGGA